MTTPKQTKHIKYIYPPYEDGIYFDIGTSDSYKKNKTVSYQICECEIGKDHEEMTKQTKPSGIREEIEKIIIKFWIDNGKKNSLTEDDFALPVDALETLFKKEMEREMEEIRQAVFAHIQESFDNWAGNSQYVTGSWNTGEYVDSEKRGKYWDSIRKTAWEQFATELDKKAGTPLKDLPKPPKRGKGGGE